MPKTRNNGPVNGPVHNLLVQIFTLGSSKIEVFETCFDDIVTTQYDHPRYVTKSEKIKRFLIFDPKKGGHFFDIFDPPGASGPRAGEG